MRLRLFALVLSTLAVLTVHGPATAQLYMSGGVGVYSNLESTGVAGRTCACSPAHTNVCGYQLASKSVGKCSPL